MHGPTQERVQFDAATAAMLAAVADTLIPAGDGFPVPSELRIVEDFMTRYVAAGDTALYLPGVSEADVAALAGRLAEGFASAAEPERTAAVTELESAEPELFGRLRALVYAGYYSRPGVRAAIAAQLTAGHDFRGAPQPYGYADVIEEWDMDLIKREGSYIATEDVVRVDAVKLAALVAAFEAERNGADQ